MHFLKYIFLQPLKSSLLVFLFSICKCRKMPSVQESDRAFVQQISKTKPVLLSTSTQ